jgi:thiamine transport system permease protein
MLGFGPLDVARHLDGPVIRAEWPGLATLVFLLCFTSFAIVLTLGGGRATLEVAIYEALRVDLDFGRAAWLGLVQIAICLVLALGLQCLVGRAPVAHTVRLAAPRPDRRDRRLLAIDALVLVLTGLLVGPPLASIAAGAGALPAILDRDLAQALATSLAIGAASAALACGMAVALAAAAIETAGRRALGAGLYEVVPVLVLAMPPFALAAGLYLLVRRFADPAIAGFALLPVVNALAALPFASRFVAPALRTASERYGRLADHLGLVGTTRWRIVEWPLLRRPFLAAAAMAMALSVGDFGIVALFGGTELRTLPYLLYERLGAYRLEEAAGIGFVLVAAAFALAYGSARFADADS